jgi:hypothetical protein
MPCLGVSNAAHRIRAESRGEEVEVEVEIRGGEARGRRRRSSITQ